MLFLFILWLIVVLALFSVPIVFWKNGSPMTLRDMFFVFIGMVAMGLHSLLVIIQ